mmetsp:Transcript_56119/g.64394  ORF Transcript_56119/g.64394 Transcript_56119/m.64394 type:complete len:136 (-) Transcript_56119:232-639(-)
MSVKVQLNPMKESNILTIASKKTSPLDLHSGTSSNDITSNATNDPTSILAPKSQDNKSADKGENTQKVLQSILKKPKANATDNPRTDFYGVQILRGVKKHRITFRPELQNIILVESYKKYNAEDFAQTSCHCITF